MEQLRNSPVMNESTSSISSVRSVVTFSTVEINHHAMIVGDNPSTKEGPPLEIDWKPQETYVLDLDDYENSIREGPPRQVKKMLSFAREDVLLSNGYSRDQINQHIRSIELERQDSETKLKQQQQKLGRILPTKFCNKKTNGKMSKMMMMRRSWS